MLLFLAGTFLYQKFLSVFLVVLENSQYGHYEEWLMKNTNGMNAIKIIVLHVRIDCFQARQGIRTKIFDTEKFPPKIRA